MKRKIIAASAIIVCKSLLLILFLQCCRSEVSPITPALKKEIDSLNSLTQSDTTAAYSNYHSQALAIARRSGYKAGEVKAMQALGDHYALEGDSTAAAMAYWQSLLLAKQQEQVTLTVDGLHKLAALESQFIHWEKSESFYQQALLVSQLKNDSANIACCYEALGQFHRARHSYAEALNDFVAVREYSKHIGDSVLMADCFNNIGSVYHQQGLYLDAISSYREALVIKKKLHREEEVAKLMLNTGIAYKEQGFYDLALKALLEAAPYYEKQQPSRELGSCYNAIGNTALELHDFETAMFYHIRSLRIRQAIGDKKSISFALTNIGATYMKMGKYTQALDYLHQSLDLKTALNDSLLIASSLNQIGEVYLHQGNLEQAESYFLNSLEMKAHFDDPKETAINHNNLAELFLRRGKSELALIHLETARRIAVKSGIKDVLRRNYEITIDALRKAGREQEALAYYDRFISLKDSLFNAQKNKAISEMQTKYETGQKEHTINLLNEQTKAQAAIVSEQHTLIYSLVTGTFLLLTIAVFAYRAYRLKKRAHLQSEELVRQKHNMLSELHHRIKNNLQVLISLLELQQGRLDDPASKSALKVVENRLDAMLLIHKGLYGKSTDGFVSISDYVEQLAGSLLKSYGYSANELREIFIAEGILLHADMALNVGFICNEIISNAIKHAFPKAVRPELRIRIWKEPGQICIVIADNGPGIPEKDSAKDKNAFGLRLIHLFTDELKGKVLTVSDTEGTRYEVIIPYVK